jgi:hypothetical protein
MILSLAGSVRLALVDGSPLPPSFLFVCYLGYWSHSLWLYNRHYGYASATLLLNEKTREVVFEKKKELKKTKISFET